MSENVVIIDGNSLINRAFYAMQRPMITSEGIYTQGIYGFINMLQKIETDYEPNYITVAFDLKAPTFRHLEYEQYKAGRKPMPPELVMQMPLLKDVLHAMNIHTLEMEGFEADDIIGSVARVAEEEGIKPLIITGDRDALQLASKETRVLITKKGISDFELYDYDKMVERYGLTPTQFIDLKGLMGDSSDNIPGIPGIGEKTGIALLEQFGSIENMLEHTDEIAKAGLKKKVEENAQLAVMSKRLATINRFVPIEIDFEKLKKEKPDYEKLIELYTKLEFKSFLKRLKISPEAEVLTAEVPQIKRTNLKTQEELASLEVLRDSETVYLKVFGDGNHIQNPEITGIFLMNKQEAFYIDCMTITIEDAVSALNEHGMKLVGHDLKNDLYSLMFYGFTEFTTVFDTAIAEYVLDVAKSKYELPAMALEKLHIKVPTYEEFIAGDDAQLDMFTDKTEKSVEYASITGKLVFELMEKQRERIEDENLTKVLYEIELPLIETLAAMEIAGMRTERGFLDEFGKELKEKIETTELAIYDYAGEQFNVNSPLQLGDILFEKLQLPSGKKTKRGYSTSADILEKIKDKHPIVPAVLEYRNLTKLNSTYVEGMKPLIGFDGKIRAHFQQTVTTTGRISCTEPNLQNIPIRQELGRTLRKAFTATEGHTLVGADYSQIELRVLAHLSQDESLIDAFNRGEDIHKTTASRVLGIPKEKVTALDRSRAKAVNFGVIYGMSGFGLSEELHITRKEAEEYIRAYFEKHQKVKEYMDLQIEKCRKSGYSETMTGRKRMIHEINASSYMVRQLGERLAMNSPIQGSAADIIKLAMNRVYAELKRNHPNSKLILQVHDELIIDADNRELEEIKRLLVQNMESAVKLSVKLIAELNTGSTWYELK